MNERKIIVLTPVKNEAYILPAFLKATARLADAILVADQNSTDGSAAVAAGFDKVSVIENKSPEFDEASRQNLLIEEARRRFGEGNLLLAIDADELFFPRDADCESARRELLDHPPGTTLLFDKPTLHDGVERWLPYGPSFPLGYVDDGIEHRGTFIHGRRIPTGSSPGVPVENTTFVHLDLLDLDAHRAKRCYYSCLETLSKQTDRKTRWQRGHSRLRKPGRKGLQPVDPAVFAWFEQLGVEIETLRRPKPYWWDHEVLKFFAQYGCRRFWWDGIWHRPWHEILAEAEAADLPDLPERVDPPPLAVDWAREFLILAVKEATAIKRRIG